MGASLLRVEHHLEAWRRPRVPDLQARQGAGAVLLLQAHHPLPAARQRVLESNALPPWTRVHGREYVLSAQRETRLPRLSEASRPGVAQALAGTVERPR